MCLKRVEIEFPVHDESSRTKAMIQASKMNGVVKVEAVRERNLLVVTGMKVDCVELTNKLRKKFPFANVVSVRDVSSDRTRIREAWFGQHDYSHLTYYNHPIPPQTQSYYQPSTSSYSAVPVYDRDPPMCSIM